MFYHDKIYCYGKTARKLAWIIAILSGIIGSALTVIGILLLIFTNEISITGVILIIFGILFCFYFIIYMLFPNFSEWFYVDDKIIAYCSGSRKIKTFNWSDIKKCTLLGYKEPDVILLQIDDYIWEYNFRRFGYGYNKKTIVLPYKTFIYDKISEYIKIEDPYGLLRNND